MICEGVPTPDGVCSLNVTLHMLASFPHGRSLVSAL